MRLLVNAQEIELLAALGSANVCYLVVGGHAVIFHGYVRVAKDLDLWVLPEEQNAHRLAYALSRVRIVLAPQEVARLALPDLQMQIKRLNIELLTSVAGLQFKDASPRAVVSLEQGTKCYVLGFEDLIQNKLALARESDLEDVRQLQALRARGG